MHFYTIILLVSCVGFSNRQLLRVFFYFLGDEQIEGMSVSDIPEFTDPAILAVKEKPKVCYTKEELINLREAPLSKKKPDFLETTEG